MGMNQPNTIKYAMVKKLSKIRCLKKNHIFLAKIEVINNKLKQMIPQLSIPRTQSHTVQH